MIYDTFVKWLDNLDLSSIDANPITFNLNDFETELDFIKSMFLCGRHLSMTDDIVVRYSKPYTEDKEDVIYCFQILRSKAKMFFNYLRNTDINISCILASNKDIKDGIKFFNSLGVKGEDMVSLLSKESDYTSMIKDELNESPCDAVKVEISIEYDDKSEVYYPMLSYNFMTSNGYSNYENTKEWINGKILKIEKR